MRILLIAWLACLPGVVLAQAAPGVGSMTQQRLHNLIVENADDVFIAENFVRFRYQDVDLLCISDVTADRMRIVSPIAEITEVEFEELVAAMAANFHSALDARYAIGEGMVFAAYIHPLSPLTEAQVLSAMSQVATAKQTFGTEYSSGAMVFGGVAPP